MSVEYSSTKHKEVVQIPHFDLLPWQLKVINVELSFYSGLHCGPWASGFSMLTRQWSIANMKAFEPPHDKTNKMICSWGILWVWSESSLCALRIAKDPRDGCPSWSESSLGTQTILLVLLWGGWFLLFLQINAMANKAAGKGYENENFYSDIKFQFLGIENIHVMRNSLQKLIDGELSFWLWCNSWTTSMCRNRCQENIFTLREILSWIQQVSSPDMPKLFV